MQVSSHSRSTQSAASVHERELAEALHLIAHGDADVKVRYIAERDPDWFVDHVLSVDYVDRDEATPTAGPIDRRMLDQAIARIALRDRTFGALRASA